MTHAISSVLKKKVCFSQNEQFYEVLSQQNERIFGYLGEEKAVFPKISRVCQRILSEYEKKFPERECIFTTDLPVVTKKKDLPIVVVGYAGDKYSRYEHFSAKEVIDRATKYRNQEEEFIKNGHMLSLLIRIPREIFNQYTALDRGSTLFENARFLREAQESREICTRIEEALREEPVQQTAEFILFAIQKLRAFYPIQEDFFDRVGDFIAEDLTDPSFDRINRASEIISKLGRSEKGGQKCFIITLHNLCFESIPSKYDIALQLMKRIWEGRIFGAKSVGIKTLIRYFKKTFELPEFVISPLQSRLIRFIRKSPYEVITKDMILWYVLVETMLLQRGECDPREEAPLCNAIIKVINKISLRGECEDYCVARIDMLCKEGPFNVDIATALAKKIVHQQHSLHAYRKILEKIDPSQKQQIFRIAGEISDPEVRKEVQEFVRSLFSIEEESFCVIC